MKTILVPVDFSIYSEYALEVAANIVAEQGGEIIVLHMMGISDSVLDNDEAKKVFDRLQYMELAKERFNEFLDKPYLKGIKVKDTVANHKIFTELADKAEELGADLIVMGSHGVTGFKDVFVGSNTEKVVRTSEIPVLVIKNPIKNFSIKRAVFATDFNSENIPAFQKSRRFLQQFGVEPELLFVNMPEKFFNSREMKAKGVKFLSDARVDNPELYENIHYYSDYTLESGVYHFCGENDIDVIIVPTHGRRGLAHFFYGSAGENISNKSKIPVLTMKIQKT